MQNDREFPVTYRCECGATKTIAGISPVTIAAEFEKLGWLNMEVHISSERVDYVETCPDCATAHYEESAGAAMVEVDKEEYQEWLAVQDTYDDFLAGAR